MDSYSQYKKCYKKHSGDICVGEGRASNFRDHQIEEVNNTGKIDNNG